MKTLILKVGGSLLSPSREILFDVQYAKALIQKLKNIEDTKFIIITGGGSLARSYMKLIQDAEHVSHMDLDLIGIAVNNVHATMLRSIIGHEARPEILSGEDIESSDSITFEEHEKFIIAGGAVPGHSGDGVALKLAIRASAKEVLILKSLPGVYDADPKTNSSAKLLHDISWDEYFKIIGTREFIPKAEFPIDPVTAQKAQELGMKFVVMSGKEFLTLNTEKEWESSGTIII